MWNIFLRTNILYISEKKVWGIQLERCTDRKENAGIKMVFLLEEGATSNKT